MRRAFVNGCCWALVAVACTAGMARAEDPAPSDPKFFEAKVYPIFQSRCVSCHGPEKQKGELRLDTAEGINKGGENGALLVRSKTAHNLTKLSGRSGQLGLPCQISLSRIKSLTIALAEKLTLLGQGRFLRITNGACSHLSGSI